MPKIQANTTVYLTNGTTKLGSALVVGDVLYGYDLALDTMSEATITSITSASESGVTYAWFSEDVILASTQGILVSRQGSESFVLVTQSNDTAKMLPIQETGTKDVVSTDDAYAYGSSLNTLSGNWSNASKWAFLAGMFDLCGYFITDGNAIRGAAFVLDNETFGDDYALIAETLCGGVLASGTTILGKYIWQTTSPKQAKALTEGMASYLKYINTTSLTKVNKDNSSIIKSAEGTYTFYDVTVDVNLPVLIRGGLCVS